MRSRDVVICGCGMAGLAAAYHLVVRHGVSRVTLVDELPPLTLTSNKGTEAYRNWWPGPDPTMVRFMNRSIDLLEELAEETANAFHLNRRGYVFVTTREDEVTRLQQSARKTCELGAGPLRVHPGPVPYTPPPAEGFRHLPDGADLITDPRRIRDDFPFLCPDVCGLLHVRRAGWLDSRALGHWLLDQVERHGGEVRRDRLVGARLRSGRVEAVRLASGDELATGALVLAPGPRLKEAGAMLGLDLPVACELHGKLTFSDPRGIVPPEAPLMIWNDPVDLGWSDDERSRMARDPESRFLLGSFPPGVHFRPRGGEVLVIWTYDAHSQEPVWPPRFHPRYGEVLLRGLASMIPGLAAYLGELDESELGRVDGGYYCKTRENRPLIGPLPVTGAFVLGALSGFGIMASQAAGELLAAHVTATALPDYAPRFLLSRYDDPSYRRQMEELAAESGQL